MEKIIAHIPHSSLFIPVEYAPLFYLSKEDLWKEQVYMTDLYTDEIGANCRLSFFSSVSSAI